MDNKIHILVVDDEDYNREFMEDFLQDEGYEVTTASSGEEAIELVKKKQFDLILLDVKMPGMDGVETLRDIRKFNTSVKVALLTAYGDTEMVRGSETLGVSDIIPKGISLKKAREKIKNLLE